MAEKIVYKVDKKEKWSTKEMEEKMIYKVDMEEKIVYKVGGRKNIHSRYGQKK